MLQYLFDIFRTSSKNQCSDLTIALAMFLADARSGKQEYGPDGLDYEALHRDYDALMEQEKQIRLFIGRHNQKLAKAYRTGERKIFEAEVESCRKEDEEAEAENSDEDSCASEV